MLSFFLAPLALAGALQGTPDFDAAVAAYGELDYEGALAKFKATTSASDDGERATLLLWVALCDAGIGDFDAARTSMREALRLDPTVALPTTVSPRVVALYEEEKAAAAAAPPPTPTEPAPAAPAFDIAAVPPLAWAGGAGVVLGVGAIGASGLFAAAAFEQLAIVDAPGTFQDDAKVALDAANFNAGMAIGAGVVGVSLASLGIVLLAMSTPEEAAATMTATPDAPTSEPPAEAAPAAVEPEAPPAPAAEAAEASATPPAASTTP